jgi:hypothetical protein
MSSFDDLVKKGTSWLENDYVAGVLTVFLILYANLAAPKLPSYIAKLFDNIIFKVIMFFLIVYIHNKNPTVALISAVALMLALMILDKVKPSEKEKMTSLNTSDNTNDLFANLNKLIDEAISFISSQEGQIAIEETTRAVQEGQLHPAEAEMIIKKIISAEEQGTTPLVAMSEQGAQQMASIAQAVAEGQVAQEEGQRMAAQIVIQENTLSIGQEQPPSSEQEKQMLAEEVMRQKQNIEENTGTKMTQIQLRQLCAQIEQDYFDQKMKEMSSITGLTEFNGFGDYAPLY